MCLYLDIRHSQHFMVASCGMKCLEGGKLCRRGRREQGWGGAHWQVCVCPYLAIRHPQLAVVASCGMKCLESGKSCWRGRRGRGWGPLLGLCIDTRTVVSLNVGRGKLGLGVRGH